MPHWCRKVHAAVLHPYCHCPRWGICISFSAPQGRATHFGKLSSASIFCGQGPWESSPCGQHSQLLWFTLQVSPSFIEDGVKFPFFIFLNTLALFLLVGRNSIFMPFNIRKLYSHLKITIYVAQIELPIMSTSTMANISKWTLYSIDLSCFTFCYRFNILYNTSINNYI